MGARAGAQAPLPRPASPGPRPLGPSGATPLSSSASSSSSTSLAAVPAGGSGAGGGGGDSLLSIYCYRIEDTALRDRFECQFDLSLPVSANAAIIADKLYSRPSTTASSGVEGEVGGVAGEGPAGASPGPGGAQGPLVTSTPSGLPSSTAAPSPDASEMDNSPGQGPGYGAVRGAEGGDVGAGGRGGATASAATALVPSSAADAGGSSFRFPDAVLYRLAATGMSEECDETMKRSIKAHNTFIISPDGDASLYAIPDLGGECDCELTRATVPHLPPPQHKGRLLLSLPPPPPCPLPTHPPIHTPHAHRTHTPAPRWVGCACVRAHDPSLCHAHFSRHTLPAPPAPSLLAPMTPSPFGSRVACVSLSPLPARLLRHH